MKNAIKLTQLTKTYKKFKMDQLDLEIPKGLATVLIGNNGAGKTTLLKLISGIITYESGSIAYDDKIIDCENPEFKEAMVYVPDTCCFSGFMDTKIVNKLMKLGFDSFDEREFLKLCYEFEVIKGKDLETEKISTMSTGNRMKLMICAMLARRSKYLLLDEPAANLDPMMQDLLQEKMREYLKDEDHTIIYSTHNIEQVNNVADYVIFMSDGKVIEKGMIDDLCESYRIVRGDAKDASLLQDQLDYLQVNHEIFEGFGKTKKLERLHEELNIVLEKPSLREISIYLLKKERSHVER